MAEYIEREKLIRNAELCRETTDAFIEIIKEQETADVREVVFCGECEFWNRERISCEGLARCNTGEGGIRYRNRDDFCSRGKKREER